MKKQLFYFTLLICSYNLNAQIPGEIPTSGLVTAFLFNGNAINHFGTVTNPVYVGDVTLTEDRYGISNKAYHFGGNGYINVDVIHGINTLGINGSNAERSFSYWISAESISNIGYILNTKFNLTDLYVLFQENGNVGIQNNTGGSTDYFHTDAWSSAIAENEWFHVVTIYSPNTYRHYINGVLVSGPNWWPADQYYNSNIADGSITWIGNSVGCSDANCYFDGKIDDILVYNRALTDLEILSIYNGSAAVDENSIVDFTLSPNPTTDILNITIDNYNYDFEVLDLSGRVLITTQNKSIDLSTLQAGRYFLKCAETTKPFVKL